MPATGSSGPAAITCACRHRPFPISVSQFPAEIQAVAHFAEFPLNFADEPMIVIEYAEPPAR